MVEGWFALLIRRQLQRGAFRSTDELKAAIRVYIDQTNAEPKPFQWTKPADAILTSIGRFCQRTSNSDHWGVRDAEDRFIPASSSGVFHRPSVPAWTQEASGRPRPVLGAAAGARV